MRNSGKTLANPADRRWSGRGSLRFRAQAGFLLQRRTARSPSSTASKDIYPVLQTLTTQRGARTMTLDSATGRIYLATAAFGERPAPTADNPRPRPAIVPGSFTILVVGQK